MGSTNRERINAGYTITDSIRIGTTEFVLGERDTAPARYVTWECKGGNDYFWGHYMSDRAEAERDLLRRASEERQFRDCQLAQKNSQKNKLEKDHAR